MTRPRESKKKKNNKKQKQKTCLIVDFAIQTDHRVKLKKSKNRAKNLDLLGNLKKNL